jgi:proline iminopeptidase
MDIKPTREGFAIVPGGQVWYEMYGELGPVPLVVLHGGPGFPHDSLLPLAALSKQRPVIFYDQLGCGKSTCEPNPELWTIERYVEELRCVVDSFELERFHLFGHSWGTILALEFALLYEQRLESLIFSSPCISIPKWIEDSKRMRKSLPEASARALAIGEQLGEYYSEEYIEALRDYYRLHVCRIEPLPALMQRANETAGFEVYTSMWGPNEITLTGTLKSYDRSDALRGLSVPSLFLCGRYDEASPEATEYYRSLTPRAALEVFENSSHAAFHEEEEGFVETLREFLEQIDSGAELRREFMKTSPALAFAVMLIIALALILVIFLFAN